MTQFDLFNGDADGICALQQLRLAEPIESRLVTGVKRDIALLERVDGTEGDRILVLDISLDKNRKGLERQLQRGIEVRYFDHHFAGEIPQSPLLTATIDTRAETCTSLLVDSALGGKYRAWAVVGAFGDNLDDSAHEAAALLELEPDRIKQLRELGTYLNYNGYGATVEDLHFPPDELFLRLHPYSDPLEFITDDDTFIRLRNGYDDDISLAAALKAELENERHGLYLLPDEPWARRVGGVFANRLAKQAPDRAHAMLTQLADGGFLVSVRAPLNRREGADELCRSFPTGGGRKAAAGINRLPEELYDEFTTRFQQAF